MRLVRAELLKMRRRQMTYVLPIVLVIVMVIVLLLIGGFVAPLLNAIGGSGADFGTVPFYFVYAIAGDFVFGLGSLLVMIYVGGIVGGDYSWGVLRNFFSRGESRIDYALGKAAALAIVIAIGAAICLLIGEAVVLLIATDAKVDLGSPFSPDALTGLAKALGLGLLVLFERAAIGFAVTVLMRSQIAGIVVGVILYIAEPFVAGIASAFGAIGQLGSGVEPTTQAIHWSQYLPFTIGSSVLDVAHASLGSLAEGTGLTSVVPIEQSVPVLILYGVIALAIACLAMRRQEIIG